MIDLTQVLTFSEAAEKWGLATIRNYYFNGTDVSIGIKDYI